MSADEAAHAHALALRERVAFLESTHLSVFRFTDVTAGSGAAFDAISTLTTAPLHLSDAAMRATLMLEQSGLIFADALIGREDESYVLVVDGPTPEAVRAHLDRHGRSAGRDGVKIDELTLSHRVLSLHGPYAWELLGEALNQDFVGMPYLSLCSASASVASGSLRCIRAGKTAEYGYDLLVPQERFDEVVAHVCAVGRAFDLAPIDLAALDLAAFESGFFCPRHAPKVRSPLVRQLRWRLDRERDFIGSSSLTTIEAHTKTRVVQAVSTDALPIGASATLDGEHFGEVVACAWSSLRDEWISMIEAPIALAHPGLDGIDVAGRRARSIAAPLLDNRSLYVGPQRHAYKTRHEDVFPPIVGGAP